jgi:hypothetical protein
MLVCLTSLLSQSPGSACQIEKRLHLAAANIASDTGREAEGPAALSEEKEALRQGTRTKANAITLEVINFREASF